MVMEFLREKFLSVAAREERNSVMGQSVLTTS